MTAQYWTITGYDIWKMDEVTIKRLKNLNTGEILSCNSMKEVDEHKFVPVMMPKIKLKTRNLAPDEKKKVAKLKKSKRKSKYKGVSRLGNKWRAQVHEKSTKRNIHLGTFDSELLAAAAYQEHIGNHKEAKRLRNEYEEGDGMPEHEVQGGMRSGDFPGA